MIKEYDDSELLYLVNNGSEEAYNILYEKYKPAIEIQIRKYLTYAKKVGLEYNDLMQEGMIGLSEAIASYKDTKDTKFFTFATLCVRNQIISALTSYGRKKYMLLNESRSLDYKTDDERSMLDFLKDSSKDPEKMLMDMETFKEINAFATKDLSDFETQVFELKMAGLNYNEISMILNKSYKSISTAMSRIQKKLKSNQ